MLDFDEMPCVNCLRFALCAAEVVYNKKRYGRRYSGEKPFKNLDKVQSDSKYQYWSVNDHAMSECRLLAEFLDKYSYNDNSELDDRQRMTYAINVYDYMINYEKYDR